jgi:hypothetical protein
MTIKRQLPWSVRILVALAIGLTGSLAMWTYDLEQGGLGLDPDNAKKQLVLYKSQVQQLSAERDEFSATVNAAESQLNIERSAQKQLASQVRVLEAENMRLKEDLAFFESLLPNATGPQGIAIRRLKIDQVAPNQLRYRLLVMQGGKADKQFVGSLQLAITGMQDGRNAMMTFPEGNLTERERFKLSFKHYQRVEGILTLPEGVSTKLVQARVLENGQVRAQLSANL